MLKAQSLLFMSNFMKHLNYIELSNFLTSTSVKQNITLSYQVFGKTLHTAPIVVVNHALTGNSNVSGHDGWWQSIVGEGKTIDTTKYTVISFNIPGNGYDNKPENLIENYKDFIREFHGC